MRAVTRGTCLRRHRRHIGSALAGALALGLLLWAQSLGAGPAPALPGGLAPGGAAAVAEVIDGDSLTLSDGRTIRMVGIQAPKLGKGRPDFPDWPLSHEARSTLEELAAGKSVTLAYGGAHEDRFGRVLAQLAREDGLWLQGEMLRQGLARVYTFPDNRAAAAEMLVLEREARAARRGIWADPYYAVRKPEEALRYAGRFELVEGRIVTVARNDAGVFLNFGADWHTAFTLRLRADALKLFRAAKLDPLTLEGADVRVRGYIRRDRDRAVIDITHPEEIERL